MKKFIFFLSQSTLFFYIFSMEQDLSNNKIIEKNSVISIKNKDQEKKQVPQNWPKEIPKDNFFKKTVLERRLLFEKNKNSESSKENMPSLKHIHKSYSCGNLEKKSIKSCKQEIFKDKKKDNEEAESIEFDTLRLKKQARKTKKDYTIIKNKIDFTKEKIDKLKKTQIELEKKQNDTKKNYFIYLGALKLKEELKNKESKRDQQE